MHTSPIKKAPGPRGENGDKPKQKTQKINNFGKIKRFYENHEQKREILDPSRKNPWRFQKIVKKLKKYKIIQINF